MSTLTDCVETLALLPSLCATRTAGVLAGVVAHAGRLEAYLRLSVPAMLMGIFEWWSWDLVTFLAGLCPDPQTALAANALLGSAIMAAYALPIGLQAGVQTLVGNALSAMPREARLGAKSSVLAICCMVAQCSLLYTFRRFWASPSVPSLPWARKSRHYSDGLSSFVLVTGCGSCHWSHHRRGQAGSHRPILCIAYWVLGLPLGALAAFSVRGMACLVCGEA